ncbi:MAG TPA: DUF72 domain-containing protein [Gammaproteobacteria bacterium]|nr:DUF72 domain-containing protein [Gammaproteobacteria bacterium]
MTGKPTANSDRTGHRPLLEVGARGWDHDAWVGSFYPDDLPAAWRLAYYANEFSTVLVPVGQWQGADPGEIAGWAADVPERFVFFVELPGTMPERPRDPLKEWRRRLDPLKDQLGGLLVRNAGAQLQSPALEALVAEMAGEYPVWLEPDDADALPQWVEAAGAQWSWAGQRQVHGRTALGLVAMAGEQTGLRGLRDLLQGLLEAGTDADDAFLIFAGDPPDIDVLHHAITIARLLGA